MDVLEQLSISIMASWELTFPKTRARELEGISMLRMYSVIGEWEVSSLAGLADVAFPASDRFPKDEGSLF